MKQRRSAIATVCVLAIGLWCITGRPLASQGTTIDVPEEVRQAVRALLASDSAKFLSGSGLTAANILAGNTANPDELTPGQGVEIAGPTAGYREREESEEEGNEVIVNDPTQDLFTAADV